MGATKNSFEDVQWDLHEQQIEEQKPEFSLAINPIEFGIEETKAKEMVSGLDTILSEREILKNAYIDVIELPINTENLEVFKELRLKLVKNRTSIEKWHKTNKAFYLAGGRFVDAIKNKEVSVNDEMEEKLKEGEKYFENQEKERKRILNEKRIEIIRPYVDDVTGLDFTEFDDENFDDFVLGKKTRFENEQKEREAEALRVEKERLAEIERQRLAEIENEKIRVENARLQKEAEKKELALQAERKLQAEKEAKLLAENDAKLKAEQDAKAKLEAELQAKKDAETKAENERLAKIEAEKKAADKLLKAGQKKQIESWIETFQIEIPEHLKDDKIANNILSKFWAFKSWAKKETENLTN